MDFNIIGITESRLQNKKKSLTNTSLQGYSIEHCPTESRNGGALLYIKYNLIYKVRNDLVIYKSWELEIVFIAILMPRNKS